jgi:hypothetical protein
MSAGLYAGGDEVRRRSQSAASLQRKGSLPSSPAAVPWKRELHLHAAEWDAVCMALSAYLARLGDVFATVDASDELPSAMTATMLTALRLATRTVMSLHGAIGASKEARERAARWKRRRKGGGGVALIVVRHSAVELIPGLLEDFAGELAAMDQAEAGKAFLRLAKAMAPAFDRVPGNGA